MNAVTAAEHTSASLSWKSVRPVPDGLTAESKPSQTKTDSAAGKTYITSSFHWDGPVRISNVGNNDQNHMSWFHALRALCAAKSETFLRSRQEWKHHARPTLFGGGADKKATQVHYMIWKLSTDKIKNSEKHSVIGQECSGCSLYFHFSSEMKGSEGPAGHRSSRHAHTHTHTVCTNILIKFTHNPEHSYLSHMFFYTPLQECWLSSMRILHETNFAVFVFCPQEKDLVFHLLSGFQKMYKSPLAAPKYALRATNEAPAISSWKVEMLEIRGYCCLTDVLCQSWASTVTDEEELLSVCCKWHMFVLTCTYCTFTAVTIYNLAIFVCTSPKVSRIDSRQESRGVPAHLNHSSVYFV